MIRKHLLISGHTFEVVYGTPPETEGEIILGTMNPKDLEILIREDMPESQREETILHEVVHTILQFTGHGDTEEGVVEALGNGLYNFLKDNKDLKIE